VSKRYLKNMFHIFLESLKPLDNKNPKKKFFCIVFLGEKFNQISKSPVSGFFRKFSQIFNELNFEIKNFFFQSKIFHRFFSFFALKNEYYAKCRFIKQICFELDYY
jgi:hypothetical protein